MSTSQRQFRKRREIKAIDSDRQIAVGAALVPNAVDTQGDWLRASTITGLADDYMAGLGTDSEQGVMHVKFPEDDLSVVENRVLDRPETINGTAFDAGTWILGYKIHDPGLYQMVEDGVLGGFSIGGVIHETEETLASELPADVAVSEAFVDDDSVARITDATIREVSLVDQPAVPGADIVALKSAGLDIDSEKTGGLTDPASARSILEERGHSPDDARRLAMYLTKYGESEIQPTEPNHMSTNTKRRAESPDTDEQTAEDLGIDTEDVGFIKRLRRVFTPAESDETEDTDSEAANKNNETTMTETTEPETDGDNGDSDAPEWVKELRADVESIAEQTKQNSDHLDDLVTADETESESATEDAEKGEGAEADAEADDDTEEPPAWADEISSKIDEIAEETAENAEVIDHIGKQSGVSTQLSDIDAEEAAEKRKNIAEVESEVFDK